MVRLKLSLLVKLAFLILFVFFGLPALFKLFQSKPSASLDANDYFENTHERKLERNIETKEKSQKVIRIKLKISEI